MNRMSSSRSNRRYLLIPLILFFLSGCVYYNTFFLAKRKFEEAEKSQKDNARKSVKQGQSRGGQPGRGGRPGQPGRGDDSPGQRVSRVSQQERMLYDDAIKKASKVLKFHPDSRWADDALWLIGKAYFNMGDYLQADRKFKELVTNHPESKFADESYFFMGLSQIELGRAEQALDAFNRLKSDFPKSDYIDDVYFARGKIARNEGEYGNAVDLFNEYLQKFPKGDSAAEARYYSGQCIEETGDYYGAYLAYSDVSKYKPSKQLYFDATLAAASAALKTDSISVGMEILDELAGDEKYFEYSARIQLKIAEGFRLQGKIDEAIETYTQVTGESPRSLESAEAYYRLGLIYQTDLFDLEKAKDAFSKSQSENSASEYRNLALARSAQIAKLESYQLQLQRADSVMTAEQSGGSKTEVPKDSSETLETVELGDSVVVIQPADSTGSSEELKDEETTSLTTVNPDGALDRLARAERDREDSLGAEESSGSGQAGDDNMATAMENSRDENSDRGYTVPLTDFSQYIYGVWEEGSEEAALYGQGDLAIPGSNEEAGSEKTAEELEIARQDSIKQDIIRTGIETRFLLAELYAYDLNRPDSAIREFLQIADQYSESAYAPRSLLACASLELKRSDTVSADGYFRRLVSEHPLSPQASVAAEQLGLKIDRADNARGLYAHAESLALDQGRLDSAVTVFSYIEDNFPDLAPQASFAIAWALEKNQTAEDSSAYYAYNRVCELYPQSVYAAAAKTKMGQGSTAQPRKRPEHREDIFKKDEEVVPDADSLRQLALGLQPAPPVRKQGEFVYPERLLDRQLKGQVLFKVRLNVFGKVEEYEIIGPSGEYAIDSSATQALLETEFDTSRLDLAELDSFFKYSIRFERPDINIFNDPYQEERRDRY
jgi:TolA-binding protein